MSCCEAKYHAQLKYGDELARKAHLGLRILTAHVSMELMSETKPPEEVWLGLCSIAVISHIAIQSLGW